MSTNANVAALPGRASIEPGYTAYNVDVSSTDQTLDPPARAVYVGGDGNLVITTPGGDDVTFANVAGGSILPVRAKVIKSVAHGTTATGLVAIV